MKPRFYKILSVISAALMLHALAPLTASAEEGAKGGQSHATEIRVTSAEIQAKGAFKAIQVALNSARYSATKDNVYKVTVDPGKYELKSALHIYSNTVLALKDVTLTRSKQSLSNMIRTGDDTAVNKGATGYSENSNITIEGGTLNGGGTSNTMVKVTHAENFTMNGTALENLKNAHMVEAAAVDGFTVKKCSFKNQVLDTYGVGYEAIQLDITKEGHIFGCRSEAITMRNVCIDSCSFTNVPRGVGTHTQILNCPFDGIVLTNNTFKDIKSAAIQGENWKNVKITNNRIEKTPRGIAIYSVFKDAQCAFKASVISKEGKTKTAIPDSFQKPFNSNIMISGNVITDCGTVKDKYANYEPCAITIQGQELKKALKMNSDGSAGYPKGNYYISGVTVKNNTINTAGDGIYLNDVRNIAVKDNTIKCSKTSLTKKVFNPITSLTVNFNTISGNTVESAPYHGMELAATAIKEIKSNNISNVPRDGIILEAKSKVTGTITGNFITNASNYGINIRPNCAGGKISGNVISGCAKGAIRQENKATVNVGSNYYSLANMTSLKLNRQSINMGEKEKFTLVASYAPVNTIAKFTWASSAPEVATVNKHGVVTAKGFGEADITVKASNGKKAACHVKVMPAPESLTLNASMITIGKGETFDLDSKLSEGTGARAVEYTSNNPSSVKVEKAGGLVTGLSEGTATIAAETFNGIHAGCNVIVKSAPSDIWFDRGEISAGIGETDKLEVILPEGSASYSMVYKSSDDKVVSVDQDGAISALSEGSATITATAFNGATAYCFVTVKKEPTGVSFAAQSYTAVVSEPLQPEVVCDEGTASNALVFQSSDRDICRVNRKTGELTPKKPGVVTVTVRTYNRQYATCKVTVTEAQKVSKDLKN